MEPKNLSGWRLIAAIFTGLVALLPVFIFSLIPENSINRGLVSLFESTVSHPKLKPVISIPTTERVGKPVRLTIPDIDVNSSVEYVGLASDGSMGVPENRDDVAWFNLGTIPGENGSAVIAGHYGIENGKGSVFDNLYKLRKGDRVYIKDDKGAAISFVVRESRRYNPKADASGIFSSNDGKPHLNLVTCEGVWDKNAQQYSKRLVVFADKE